jgi:hypothetical protein
MRRDKHQTQATPRDLHILACMAHMEAVRRDHLRILFSMLPGKPFKGQYMADSTLKDQIDRYREAGWIEYQRYLSEPGWAWPTRRSLRMCGLDGLYAPHAPAESRYHHLWAVNEIRLSWYSSDDEEQLAGIWISERQLKAEMAMAAKKKRVEEVDGGYSRAPIQLVRGAIPDGVVVGEDCSWVDVVEVELTNKGPDETRAKLERLCRSVFRQRLTGEEYIYSEIHFYVPSEAAKELVDKELAKLGEDLSPNRVDVVVDTALKRLRSDFGQESQGDKNSEAVKR